jgi:biopolymer transport protein ExbB
MSQRWPLNWFFLLPLAVAGILVFGVTPVALTQVDGQTAAVPNAPTHASMSSFDLLRRGGILMWPLFGLSVFVIALAVERAIALRREKLFPAGLVDELGRQSELAGGFDPRQTFRLCQAYPSSAGRILRAMLLKIGRPQGEIEHAVSEAAQREANRLQYAVSWLSLSAAVAPLIGLLGTVQGITQAFYRFTQTNPSQNPGNALAEGIYTALVTTLVGLIIAIPATIIAHYFETRIVRQLNEVEEMTASLMPQIERYEGRLRFAPASDRAAPGLRDTAPEPADVADPTV